MILDRDGRLVWFDPLPTGSLAEDVNEQTYQGQPVLTWWQGQVASGYGLGDDLIVNSSYRTVATVHAGEGYQADLHEFQITPEGTALITAYQPAQANLPSIGGPRNGTVLDSIVQEIDITTGRVLWEWHALGHVPLSASETGKPTAATEYDYFHINSIQQLPQRERCSSPPATPGPSTRSAATPARSSGRSAASTRASRWVPEPTSNGSTTPASNPTGRSPCSTTPPPPRRRANPARSMLTLNTSTMSVSLDHSYTHTRLRCSPAARATIRSCPTATRSSGWGAEPDFSEYTPSGQQIFSASFSAPVTSYRAFRHPWTAQPTTRARDIAERQRSTARRSPSMPAGTEPPTSLAGS